MRRQLQQDHTIINHTDFGTGGFKQRSVAYMAKNFAKPAPLGQLIYRLVYYFKPAVMLDLGTSLGLTTAYQALANPAAELITVEGCPNVAQQAAAGFKTLGTGNVRQVTGNLDEVLAPLVQTLEQLDWVYFDANHRYEATLNYFRICLQKAHAGSVFVVDDINWSTGMRRAWEEIKQHPQVTVTVDLFYIGLVFFRPGQAREHFTLYYPYLTATK